MNTELPAPDIRPQFTVLVHTPVTKFLNFRPGCWIFRANLLGKTAKLLISGEVQFLLKDYAF
jgi:hypothetical protein